MNIINNIFTRFLNPRVIQYSPPRSGSTLVYNILREIFPQKQIIKTHALERRFERDQIVSTYRNPLDAISSSINRYKLEATDDVIEQQIQEFKENGLYDIFKVIDSPKTLLLKYEDFYDNFDYIYANLESHFNITLNQELKDSISSKLSIPSVKKMTAKMNDFSEFDPENHFHGNHISEFNGQIGRYNQVLNKQQAEHIRTELADYMKHFGY
ncbi:hypothetical protein [Persicirhabdus sediminis]|uniref:Sulfotransferase family protein n=1 Tax=Persicirhabdus sediminis TaxID=454144 RepID=A0A8J7SLN5_9BACT|nr:hypothetical protein [Persicirhabdus sediminis]MBK1790518.1 hypothetical protein [Persicirhabdus sediminis]